ncbi:MAG: transcriptional regulator [Rhodospirillaceae bacterium]|jgi:predicted transcriptional regulator|nr:transcriptional regulator [Rhodospirillaceae bacterium]MBT5659736.1 transcriptional regulator [Rhodospirillaceae bacterium]MBT5752677.1 transcriptional regulator [Rhodospirillaceae bacterium]
MSEIDSANETLLEITSSIVSAYLSNSNHSTARLPELINTVHSTLAALGKVGGDKRNSAKPAVPIRKSITPAYLVCLEDGKRLKMLKRHLRTAYNLTPDEYRAKWGLPIDYPMVAPNYAKQRSEFAKKIGLGRKKGARL